MREILFRGKRENNGEWVEGNLFIPDKVTRTDAPAEILMGTNIVRISYEVDPATVGQFTGLLDKTGKKIFEGDILKTHYDEEHPDAFAHEAVVWDRNAWCTKFSFFSPDPLGECDVLPWSEIVGNIHDNPELLEGGGWND